MCEDYFDNMIVFSDAWWIGTEGENPDETRLDFPKELSEVHLFNILCFGEASSGDDCAESNTDLCEGEDDKIGGLDSSSKKHASAKTENLSFGDLKNVYEDAVKGAQISEQNQESTVSESKAKKQCHSALPVTISKGDSHSNQGPLVQATISTLFKKAEKKKVGSSLPSQAQTPSQAHKTPSNQRKPASQVSGEKSLQASSKRKIIQDGGPGKKGKLVKEKDAVGKRLAKKKEDEVEDDIEELSSSSHDTDEDWAA